MNSPTQRQHAFEKRLERAEERLKVYDGLIEKILNKTIQSTWVFEVVLVLVGIFAGGFALWSGQRLDNYINTADRKIESILSRQHRPRSARMVLPENTQKLKYNIFIRKDEVFGRTGFFLMASSQARLIIEGDNPGVVLGFQSSHSGKFIEELERRSGQEIGFNELKFHQLDQAMDGRTLPSGVPVTVNFSMFALFNDCDEAKAFAQDAAKEGLAVATTLKPILLNPLNESDSFVFQGRLIDESARFECATITQ